MYRLLVGLVAVSLSACSRVPDCDSDRAAAQVRDSIHAMVRSQFQDPQRTPMRQHAEPASAPTVSDRHRRMNDVYLPHLSIADDARWLQPRIAARAEDRFKDFDLSLYLALQESAALKKAIRIRMTDHESVPDRQDGDRTIPKVCRAKLWIEPATDGAPAGTPVTVVFSANPQPRRSPVYIPINWFEASEPALPFQVSDSEKVVLMMYGATKDMGAVPRVQNPREILLRRALRAYRQQIEQSPQTAGPVDAGVGA